MNSLYWFLGDSIFPWVPPRVLLKQNIALKHKHDDENVVSRSESFEESFFSLFLHAEHLTICFKLNIFLVTTNKHNLVKMTWRPIKMVQEIKSNFFLMNTMLPYIDNQKATTTYFSVYCSFRNSGTVLPYFPSSCDLTRIKSCSTQDHQHIATLPDDKSCLCT